MIDLVIAPIVTGDGEVTAFPILIRRIVMEFCPGVSFEVLKPIRQPESSLIKVDDDCLEKAVGHAVRKLSNVRFNSARRVIVMLIDADGRCAAQLGPELKQRATAYASHFDIASVVAVDEYETWFVASAASLAKYLDVTCDEIPTDPEATRTKTKWIEDRFREVKYTKPIDQPRLTDAMDLKLCRRRSPSFDKLCREIERMAQVEGHLAEG